MARKPNYSFERNNRAKAKAAKREAKRLAKAAAREKKAGIQPARPTEGAPSPETGATETSATESGVKNPAASSIPADGT